MSIRVFRKEVARANIQSEQGKHGTTSQCNEESCRGVLPQERKMRGDTLNGEKKYREDR